MGEDSALPGYDGIVELTWMLNTKYPSAPATQQATLGILLSLMPSWLPGVFKVGSSPVFSCPGTPPMPMPIPPIPQYIPLINPEARHQNIQ